VPPTPTASAPTAAAGAEIATTTAQEADVSSPSGDLRLISPIDEPTYGATTFVWDWDGELPSEFGFEVVVWRPDEEPRGIHDAVMDNQSGRIQRIGPNRYRLDVNIARTPSVRARSAEYNWTVRVVQIAPSYGITEIQAEPERFRYKNLGDGGDGGDDDNHGEPIPYGLSTTLSEPPELTAVAATTGWLTLGLLLGTALVLARSRKDD
jgi:hypothetical protein